MDLIINERRLEGSRRFFNLLALIVVTGRSLRKNAALRLDNSEGQFGVNNLKLSIDIVALKRVAGTGVDEWTVYPKQGCYGAVRGVIYLLGRLGADLVILWHS